MQQANYYSRPAARPREPGTITGRRGPAEGVTRMVIVFAGVAILAYAVVTILRSDAAPSRDPIGNHTGITPYGYPDSAAKPSHGRRDCTYYGGRLDCQEGGRP